VTAMTELPTALAARDRSGLLGAGIMYTAMDVDPGLDEEFNAWYTHEHLHERLSMPGFRRARRYARTPGSQGPGQRYMTIYEARDTAAFASPEYLALLDSPSEWSQRMQPRLRSVSRTIMRVRHSSGPAVGSSLASVEFSPADGEATLRLLREHHGPQLLGRPVVTGFHVVEQDAAATRAKTATQEAINLGAPDLLADWIVLIEGTGDVLLLAEELAGDPGFAVACATLPAAPTDYRLFTTLLAPSYRARD